MNSIHRQFWQHGTSLIIGVSILGCGSSSTDSTKTTVPAVSTVAANTPAPAQMPGMAPGGRGPANSHSGGTAPGGGGSSGAPSPADMMRSHGGGGGGGSSSPKPSDDPSAKMAETMKQRQMSGADQGAGNKPVNPADDPKMAEAMKKYGMSHGGGSGSTSSPDPGKMARGMGPGGKPAAPGTDPGQMTQSGGTDGASGGAAMPSAADMAKMRGGQGGNGNTLPGGMSQPGQQSKSFPPGSTDEALFNFCTAMAEGDTSTAGEYVSPKAKGFLGQLRDGRLADEKLDELKELLSPVSDLKPNQDIPATNSKRSLFNGKNQTMSFTLKKEKDAYKITELSYSKLRK